MTNTVNLETSESGVHTLSIPFGANRLIMERGRLARQANSTIVAQVGGTVVLVAAVGTEEPREGIDFFPLMVDYRDKFYAAGRIPGGFLKRENRPSNGETLRARLIDRPLRPLFPDGMFNEVQVYVTVLSYDGSNPAELVALNAASMALCTSNIPFAGPVASVRIGLIEDEFIVNPTIEQQQMSDLDLVVAGTKSDITMVESGANELHEDVMLEALEYAQENITAICAAQEQLIERVDEAKYEFSAPEVDEALAKKVKTAAKKPLTDALKVRGKAEQSAAFADAKAKVLEKLVDADAEDAAEQKAKVSELFGAEKKAVMRAETLKGTRVDGRKHDEIRQITIETDVLPRTHGSAVFTRGETQSLGVVTLGTSEDEQMIDDLNGLSYQRFYLHYNFPSYSVGECRMPRGPGRREIGHGALAERALLPMLPEKDDFPYTIRVVSEILESNGSSSMATVCSGTLAMWNAGVKMKKPVAGIAMGLIKEGDKYAILSDINGTEDHLGDMDFKVTGTQEGITALQMDIKIDGLSVEMLREALAQAAAGRKHILGIMEEAMQGDLPEISQYAPRIETITIDPSKIRDIIGSGGKTIRAMQEETGAKINVEDDGTVQVSCSDLGAINEVKRRIELLTAEAKVGATYKGKVVNITNFGAFVEILPGKDGLLHISEIDHRHIRKVEDVLELGDEVEVKCIEIDPSGRVRLSRKALIEAPEGADEDSGSGGGGEDRSGRKGRSRRDRGDREERGGRGGRGDREERGGGRRRRDRDDDDSKPAKSFDDDEDELLLDDDLFEDDDDEAGDDFDLEFEEDGDVEFNAPGNSKSDDQGGGRGRGGRSRSGGGGGRGRGGRPRAGAGAGNGGGGNRRGGGGGRGGNRGGGRGGNRGGNRY